MKKTIAEHMIDVLNENNLKGVWMGSPDLIHECADRAGVKVTHPLNVINCVLNALDRSPLFTKGYIRACSLTGKTDRECLHRCYQIKGEKEKGNLSISKLCKSAK